MADFSTCSTPSWRQGWMGSQGRPPGHNGPATDTIGSYPRPAQERNRSGPSAFRAAALKRGRSGIGSPRTESARCANMVTISQPVQFYKSPEFPDRSYPGGLEFVARDGNLAQCSSPDNSSTGESAKALWNRRQGPTKRSEDAFGYRKSDQRADSVRFWVRHQERRK